MGGHNQTRHIAAGQAQALARVRILTHPLFGSRGRNLWFQLGRLSFVLFAWHGIASHRRFFAFLVLQGQSSYVPGFCSRAVGPGPCARMFDMSISFYGCLLPSRPTHKPCCGQVAEGATCTSSLLALLCDRLGAYYCGGVFSQSV